MSALCGILGFEGLGAESSGLDKMMHSLQDHGPDGHGTWRSGAIALGHQMMHTTPESLHEQLPLHSDESQVTVTMDGRLDYRRDLVNSLALSYSDEYPDSGLVIEAYLKWGKDFVTHLEGEFALAIWDGRTHTLHCVTDPMGIRPLFYRHEPGRLFAFASEVKPLLTIGGKQTPVDEKRLAMLGVSALSKYLEPEKTFFKNIIRVPAASILSVHGGKVSLQEYWRPDPGGQLRFHSDTECREAFREVFTDAVSTRLRSAFPVASLLSGGLDSSSIASVASHALARQNQPLITLSNVPEKQWQESVTDEREYIGLMSDMNLDMHDVTAQGCGPFDNLETILEKASLASCSYQHFLYTALLRTARENGARVILDGHGGEFSASCYPAGLMAELLLSGRFPELARELRWPGGGKGMSWPVIKRQVLRPLIPWPVLRRFNRHSRFKNLNDYPLQPGWVKDVLGSETETIRESIHRMLHVYPDHRRNMVKNLRLQQTDLRQRSHAGFLGYTSASFAYPFLDKRVIEFCLAVDGRFKYKDGVSRRLLRLGMEDWLPGKIVSRNSKAPFSPDYHLRYERDKSRAEETLKHFSQSPELAAIVDFDRALTALQEPVNYDAEKSMKVDYNAQFLVPYALHLCYFLRVYGRQDQLGPVSI